MKRLPQVLTPFGGIEQLWAAGSLLSLDRHLMFMFLVLATVCAILLAGYALVPEFRVLRITCFGKTVYRRQDPLITTKY